MVKKLHSYQRVIGISLFLLMLLNLVTCLLFDKLVEITHRDEFRAFIRGNSSNLPIVKIIQPFSSVIDEEFEFEGTYFDVVRYELTAHQVTYYCVADHKEGHLWKLFETNEASDFASHGKQTLHLFFSSFYLTQSTSNTLALIVKYLAFPENNFSYLSHRYTFSLSMPTPPPKQ